MTQRPASLSVACLLDDHLATEANVSWYRAPEIPAKKLKKAVGMRFTVAVQPWDEYKSHLGLLNRKCLSRAT